MRRELLIIVLSLFTFKDVASSTTTLPMEDYTTPLEQTIYVYIPTEYLSFMDTCHLYTPEHQDLDMSNFDYPGITDHSNFMQPCHISIVVNENMTGSWLLYAKSGNADNPYVIELPFVISIEGITEDSEATTTELPEQAPEQEETTTEKDETTTVIQDTTTSSQDKYKVLESIRFEVNLNDPVVLRTDRTTLNAITDNCKLVTPSGEVLELHKELDYPGLVVQESNAMSSCLVELTGSEDAHGDWKLVAREYNGDAYIEVEQPFEIHVTEVVSTFPEGPLTIKPGKDLYIRLSQPVPGLSSCLLVAPESRETNTRRDERYSDTCAYVLVEVTANYSGSWLILAEGRISYKAELVVVVEETETLVTSESLTLTEGQSVSEPLEPQSALYCQLRDPQGVVMYSGFTACTLELTEVKKSHEGEWKMLVGVAGALTPVEKSLDVTVTDSVALHVLTSNVEQAGDSIGMTCSMVTDNDSAHCKFVRPDSAIFIAQAGVGEGRYSYFGQGVTPTDSGHHQIECGLFVEVLEEVDIGSWRCVLETESDVFSSFLTVVGNSGDEQASLEGNEVSADALEVSDSVVTLVGEEVVLSCSMSAHLEYCWFRAPNGTVISLASGVSTANYEYFGSGLESGECGIRIHQTHTSDSGTWRCNVGTEFTADLTLPINLTVFESPMVVMHGTVRVSTYSTALVILGIVYDRSPVDYCRFVSPTGYGFHVNSANIPARYEFTGTDLSTGYCRLRILDPVWTDHGSWTVAGRLSSGVEAVGSTQPVYMWGNGNITQLMLWYLMPILLLLTCLAISMMFSTKKSRRWTATRANAMRSSIRSIRSSIMRKRPSGSPPTYDDAVENIANTTINERADDNVTAITIEASNETVTNDLIVVNSNDEAVAIKRDSDDNINETRR